MSIFNDIKDLAIPQGLVKLVYVDSKLCWVANTECTHNWSQVSGTPATCTNGGLVNYECTKCGETMSVASNALGHNLNTPWVYHNNQVDRRYCSRCDYYEEKAHRTRVYQIGSEDKHEVVCDTCGRSWKEDHSWVRLSGTPASCESDGEAVYECSKCYQTKYEIIPASEHDYTYDLYEPIEEGHIATCAVCGYSEQQHHMWEVDYEQDENGSVETCACGLHRLIDEDTGEYEYFKDCFHDWERVEYTEPTCDNVGVAKYVCSKCGETKHETIPALDHDFSYSFDEPVSLGHIAECFRCGYTEQQDHLWETDFSENENGLVDTCYMCGLHRIINEDTGEYGYY